ncbi:Uncharacterised protein [Neisseria meningitidis]|uniref:Uncharacterized protein n=1 Tax=Neisseria meningitidis TaxID=487 RepID=A0AB33TYX5_NEIME|nr:hypothetical protein NM2007461_0485 [Neisseria meningitidis 2007461]CWN51211.1 Uncharacterised protein [Neisseria meningitidis]CWP99797.1 Uncharacterised protein [Neisseria meningitidis]CWQ15253.1 Uncharacterised protein [Neisseria meningitidis]CWQ20183.1 Uncharacterised protein [Neisseria meningitidis]
MERVRAEAHTLRMDFRFHAGYSLLLFIKLRPLKVCCFTFTSQQSNHIAFEKLKKIFNITNIEHSFT